MPRIRSLNLLSNALSFRAVARILLGEEHLAERSEAGSHFVQFCAARCARREKFRRFQCIFRKIMLKSIDFSAAGDFFSKYDTKLLICADF